VPPQSASFSHRLPDNVDVVEDDRVVDDVVDVVVDDVDVVVVKVVTVEGITVDDVVEVVVSTVGCSVFLTVRSRSSGDTKNSRNVRSNPVRPNAMMRAASW
jgi:hypothetical protein